MRGGEGDFKTHILTINAGEDIIERIKSFTQNGSRGLYVLSAHGVVSNVKIPPLGSNNMVLNLEVEYEILSLSGSVVITESRGVRNVKEAWRILGCEGGNRFVCGCLAELIAAGPVQVVIGSFCSLITNPYERRFTPTLPNN